MAPVYRQQVRVPLKTHRALITSGTSINHRTTRSSLIPDQYYCYRNYLCYYNYYYLSISITSFYYVRMSVSRPSMFEY